MATDAAAERTSGEEKRETSPETDVEPSNDIRNVDSVPNGGFTAWLQVAGAYFLFFNSWGVVNSFGTYQTYYRSELLQSSTPSAISWIGSIQGFLLMLVGALTGPIYDAGYFRHLLYTGSFLVVFGQMMLSLCTEYWQVLLAQAFCMGIGAGCLFVPAVAILSTYFTTRLATATGIAASGSSLGGVIYPVMVHKLIGRVGFGWTARAMGFVLLGTLLVPIAVMKVRVLPASRRKLVDLSALRELPFMLFVLGAMVGFMGLYTPFFYIQLYAINKGAADSDLAFYLLAILNAGSVAGRILPNVLADRIGPFNTLFPCALLCSVLVFCLIPISSLGSTIVFCILYGFFSGTFVSLPPPAIVSLTPDRSKIGTRLGTAFSIISVGILTGTPIAGAILNSEGYTKVWIYAGAVTMACSLMMLAARGLKFGWKVLIKT
ncbi:Aspyridones efflux protein apdF [Lasiodiplodia theobromae]|uniref:Aspyridones efflux protein apdF n=1 Tax=Lasiodiplodia theobromae TaxID=45133 RepID=A0A5N5D4E2_9PEZI|nr:Aspyridones efflux protein apdF [Lasiodiplodia theobromae]